MKLHIWADGPDTLVEVESKALDRLDRCRETGHYVFRYAAGSLAEREIEAIAAEQERAYAKLADLFGFEFPQRIEYLLTDSPEDNGQVLSELFGMEPCPTNGLSIGPNYVLGAYCDEAKAVGCHEVAHLFSYQLCLPRSELLSEGLAMYADGSFWGKPNEDWVREFLQNGAYVPVRELPSEERFYAHPSEITYPIAGAFVGFLIGELGRERFFAEVYASDAPLLETLSRLFGTPAEAVEERFIRFVKEDRHGV